jgi:hypothetical protein
MIACSIASLKQPPTGPFASHDTFVVSTAVYDKPAALLRCI